MPDISVSGPIKKEPWKIPNELISNLALGQKNADFVGKNSKWIPYKDKLFILWNVAKWKCLFTENNLDKSNYRLKRNVSCARSKQN